MVSCCHRNKSWKSHQVGWFVEGDHRGFRAVNIESRTLQSHSCRTCFLHTLTRPWICAQGNYCSFAHLWISGSCIDLPPKQRYQTYGNVSADDTETVVHHVFFFKPTPDSHLHSFFIIWTAKNLTSTRRTASHHLSFYYSTKRHIFKLVPISWRTKTHFFILTHDLSSSYMCVNHHLLCPSSVSSLDFIRLTIQIAGWETTYSHTLCILQSQSFNTWQSWCSKPWNSAYWGVLPRHLTNVL